MSDDVDALRLYGKVHMLQAMPVDGTTWVGMIVVNSPTDSALLTKAHAIELRDWLTQVIDLAPPEPVPCGCGHPDQHHGEWVVIDGVDTAIACPRCHDGPYVAPEP